MWFSSDFWLILMPKRLHVLSAKTGLKKVRKKDGAMWSHGIRGRAKNGYKV